MKVIIMLVNIKFYSDTFVTLSEMNLHIKKFFLSLICHRALENCRVEMIESNYFIKLDVCGLSGRFRGIQMKTT